MPLYEIKEDRIALVPETTFAAVGVRERDGIQRLLREQIEIISPDTLVIAEEFSNWEDSRRRIDLLGLDRGANLVVVELKRTEDGGHMDLQALRYAAMVSTMTFEQIVEAFGSHLDHVGRSDDSRTEILDFLGWDEPDDERFAQDVRIVLAAAEFSREITSSVMWLNERGLDIRCVRLRPHHHGESLFLDVQQVIPLPETADYQVRLREKAQLERAARRAAGSRDYTRYTVTISDRVHDNLPKRRAVFEVVRGLVVAGVPVAEIQDVLREHSGPRAVLSAPGDLDGDAFIAAVMEQSRAMGRAFDPGRYFCADAELLNDGGSTYALTNQWGRNAVSALDALVKTFPNQEVSYVTTSPED